MWDVTNYDIVCDILLGDDVDSKLKYKMVGTLVTIHEFGILSFVFVTPHWCCQIAMHYLPTPKCRVGAKVWWHTEL